MKKHYLSILALAMTLIMCVGTMAKAQYTVTVSSKPHNNYVSGGQTFKPTEIAEALGTDTATLHKLIMDASVEGEGDNRTSNGIVYLKTSDGKTNLYTGNINEFWLNTSAEPVSYGAEGCSWFVGITYNDPYVDEETQENVDATVEVYVGQYPKYFASVYTPSELKCQMLMANGAKQVTFDITQNVEAAKESGLAKADTILSKLQILKDYEVELPFVTGKSYEGKTITSTLDGLYDVLGAGAEDMDAFKADLDENINEHVFAEVITTKKENDNVTYSLSDSLYIPEVAAGGAWFGRYINYDEGTGEEVPLTINGPKTWGTGGNTFYTQNFTLADGKFSLTYGQYANVMKAGDTDYTYLYVVVGDKAARIKVQAKVEDPAAIDPEDMVKVGEETVQVTATVDDDYQTKSFSVDMASIIEKLGCEAADITEIFAYDQNEGISDDHTENSGGFYYNEAGRIEKWGSNAACFIAIGTLANGSFNIGQMKGHYTDITDPVTVKPQFIFKHEANFYVVTVEYTVKPVDPTEEPIEYKRVGSDGISFEMVPTSEDVWAYATTTTLDLDYIESIIGTKDFALYTDKVTAEEGKDPVFAMSNKYTCDPNPGFWYGTTTYTNEEGLEVVENAGWGTNSFGITYANGVITWYQYPGQRQVGDAYTANLYLVNEETHEYFRYVLNVSYVETESEKATLLDTFQKTVFVDQANLSGGIFSFNIESQQIADSLGVDVDALADNVTFYAFKTPSTRDAISLDNEIFLNEDGYEVTDNNVISASLSYNDDNQIATFVDICDLTFEEGNSDVAVIRLSFEANAKRVDYVYTLLSVNTALTGIDGTSSAAGNEAAAIYNAAGVKTAALSKGINIVKYGDGSCKKIIVK